MLTRAFFFFLCPQMPRSRLYFSFNPGAGQGLRCYRRSGSSCSISRYLFDVSLLEGVPEGYGPRAPRSPRYVGFTNS